MDIARITPSSIHAVLSCLVFLILIPTHFVMARSFVASVLYCSTGRQTLQPLERPQQHGRFFLILVREYPTVVLLHATIHITPYQNSYPSRYRPTDCGNRRIPNPSTAGSCTSSFFFIRTKEGSAESVSSNGIFFELGRGCRCSYSITTSIVFNWSGLAGILRSSIPSALTNFANNNRK